MRLHRLLLAFALLLGLPTLAGAAAQPDPLHVPLWTVAPFLLTLLAIAILPLLAEHFWHRNRNKALIVFVLALPILVYLCSAGGHEGTLVLRHSLEEYLSFIVLLGSLYTIAGGIVLRGDLRAGPLTNSAFLAGGAVLANLIGTTGASMLLIRPYLRTNQQRQHTNHLPVFFIFLVSNLGGLLTPLGDPPLFLGFLRGVPFAWTLGLWPQWLLTNGVVLGIFLIWDTLAYWRESSEAKRRDASAVEPLRVAGLLNLLFLAGVVAAVLFKSPEVSGPVLRVPHVGFWSEGVMAGMAFLSWLVTSRRVREANAFTWGPIMEVAVLFAGIFVTMVPALELLKVHGSRFNLTQPWHYFWLTGALSSFLDNAPTYLVFATLAASPDAIGDLATRAPLLLQAISCGAVFMGANTYIGNGPNFIVKAIADAAGFRTPTFFGYLLYSGGILLPVFALVTWFFFRP